MLIDLWGPSKMWCGFYERVFRALGATERELWKKEVFPRLSHTTQYNIYHNVIHNF